MKLKRYAETVCHDFVNDSKMRWPAAVCVLILLPSIIRADDIFPYIDDSDSPCDDFYKYACGNFEKVHPMPEGSKIWDGFLLLQNQVDEQLKELIEGKKDETDTKSFGKARDMYASCMDTEMLDRLNLSPMSKVLKGWPSGTSKKAKKKAISWNKIAELVAKYGLHFIFKLTVRADLLNATRTAIYIERDDLTLPSPLLSKSVQVLDNDFSSRKNSAFVLYLNEIITKLRDFRKVEISNEEILGTARQVNEFMVSLRDSMTLDERDDGDEIIVPMIGTTTVEILQNWSDGVLANFTDRINWKSFLSPALKRSGVTVNKETPIFITDRNLLQNLLIFVHQTDRELLGNFVYSRLATFMAPEMSLDLHNVSMEFYENNGYIPMNYPRWKYCLHKVLDYPKIGLSFAVAKKYRDKYVDEQTLARAKEMITNVKEALKELIEEANWMDEQTMNYAIYKLENILILTGSPDYLTNRKDVDNYYKPLKISKNDHFGNINRLRSFSQSKNFESLAIPRDRNSWSQSPLVVNAYYNGLNNRILFPISMMMPPFFSRNLTSFIDYARIGAIMGHELTHAFDSQGRNLDFEGSKVSWWSESTGRSYANKTYCFVKQYNNYIIDGTNYTVNGEMTLAENIADNVGLRAAFKAYKKIIHNNLNSSFKNVTNYSTNQTFFLAYASMWCRIGQTVTIDNHAPNKYRVMGPVENMDSFYEAWGCKPAVNINDTYNNLMKHMCVLW